MRTTPRVPLYLIVVLCTFVTLIVPISSAPAVHAAGGGAVPLSTVGVGARAKALSGAFTAIGGDPSSFSWNPAGQLGIDRPVLFAERGVPIADTVFNAVAYSAEVAEVGVITGGLRRLASTQIPKTDAAGNLLGHFDYSEQVASLNYARPLGAASSVGAQLKWLSQELDSATASGFSLDVGMTLTLGPRGDARAPRVGMAVQNALSTGVRWSTGAVEEPDRQIRLGVAYPFSWHKVAGTLAFDWASLDGLALGLEINPHAAWAIRGGVRHLDGTPSFSAGLALDLQGVSIDYAYAAEGKPKEGTPPTLGDRHHVSISVRL